MKNFKKIAPIALTALLFGCGEIPPVSMQVEQFLHDKVRQLGSVELRKNTDIFAMNYRGNGQPGSNGYYILSGGTKLTDDYAMWDCPSGLLYERCPDLSIMLQNDTVTVTVLNGDKDEFSKGRVEECAVLAIQYAPQKMQPTSEQVANRHSWE